MTASTVFAALGGAGTGAFLATALYLVLRRRTRPTGNETGEFAVPIAKTPLPGRRRI
jgi:hypothetical protein